MKFALTLAVIALGASASLAHAQDDVIAKRKALMKEIGQKAEMAGNILKGKAPYDTATAKAIFATFSTNIKGFGDLFPEGSDLGDTKALPEVWTDRAGFDADIAKFEKAVAENAAKAETEAGFKPAFMAVAETCRSCHQTFKSR